MELLEQHREGVVRTAGDGEGWGTMRVVGEDSEGVTRKGVDSCRRGICERR